MLIEDDPDDRDIMQDVLDSLNIPNKLIWFGNCTDALAHLKETKVQPFIILCDINLPGMNGIDFKCEIDTHPELRRRSIPFTFYSTSVNPEEVTKAYTELTVQGFFKKPDTFLEIQKTLTLIFEYWKCCRHPNSPE